MARNLENSTSENFNTQEMGPRQSTRLNVVMGGVAPPRSSTMATTHGEIHSTTIMAQAMSSKLARARAQASHLHASHTKQPAPTEQPTFVALPALAAMPAHAALPAHAAQPAPEVQPTLVAQPAPAEQPTLVAQPALAEQPTIVAQPAPVAFQAAQIGPRLSQPSGPTIKQGAFPPRFSADLTFPNSNLAAGTYHTSIAQGSIFLPSSSNPNGEQHLSRQVIELTSALAQQTTLVNQLVQRTEMQRALGVVSRSRTRADEESLQQRPGKQPLNRPQTKRSGSVHS